MKKLMRQRPFEKISVSDICNDCGINRKSFYYHFRDKYDLVNWIFYVGFVGGMDVVNYENVWDLLSDILDYFYSEREFYYAALQIEGAEFVSGLSCGNHDPGCGILPSEYSARQPG